MPGGARRVVCRLITKVPAGTPGAVVVAGVSYTAEVFDGWTSSTTNELMGEVWTTDLLIPNGLGPDGRENKDRFDITRDRLAPVQGLSTWQYPASRWRPGDQWIELHDGDIQGEPGYVGTPVGADVSRATITLHLADGLELAKHTYENEAGHYRHAPRDVIEDCCRVWQAPLFTSFTEPYWSYPWTSGATITYTGPSGHRFQSTRTETADHVTDEKVRIPNSVRLRTEGPGTQAWFAGEPLFAAGVNATALEDRLAPWRFEAIIRNPLMVNPVVGGLPAGWLSVGLAEQATGQHWADVMHQSTDALELKTLRSGTTVGDAVRYQVAGVGTFGARPGPFHYVVEGRDGFVYFYVNAQLVGFLPMPPTDAAPLPVTQYHVTPMIILSQVYGDEVLTATVEMFMYRRGAQMLMRGRSTEPAVYAGDYDLPGLPALGGLLGTYYNDESVEDSQRLGPMNEEYARRVDATVDFETVLQIVVVNLSASAGTYTLTIDGETSPPLNWNETPLGTVAKLEAMQVFAPGDFNWAPAPAVGPQAYALVVRGPYAGTNLTFAADGTHLTGSVAIISAVSPASSGGLWWPSEGSPPGDGGKLSVRWTGSILLDLAAADAYLHFEWTADGRLPRIWVGKTRAGEEYIAPYTGTDTTSVGTSLRAHLDGTHRTGWYPIVVEYPAGWPGGTGPKARLYLSTTGVDAAKEIVTPDQLSPQGVFLQDVRAVSRYETLQSIVESFGHQLYVKPEQLESGRFPGSVIPRTRQGRDTAYVLETDTATAPTLEVKADAVADALFADAQGLADQKQLTVEVFNFDELGDHLLVCQAYEQLGDVSAQEVLRQRLDSMLRAHNTVWETVQAQPSDQDERRLDSWPLTGTLLRFDWRVGDGLRVWLPEIGIEDAVPRQLMTVTRNRTPDGLKGISVGWQQRPRSIEQLLRRQRRSYQAQARTDKGDRAVTTGSPAINAVGAGAGPETTSVVPLPERRWKVYEVHLVVYGKTDLTPWNVEVNGRVTVQKIYRDGTYKVMQNVEGDDLKQGVVRVRVVPGDDGTGEANYTASVVHRI